MTSLFLKTYCEITRTGPEAKNPTLFLLIPKSKYELATMVMGEGSATGHWPSSRPAWASAWDARPWGQRPAPHRWATPAGPHGPLLGRRGASPRLGPFWHTRDVC